jgi:hypothetical protein
MFAFK